MSFASQLITWHHKHGRHHLPWQHSKTPYRIWLAEVMLQQTGVQTVIPYFEKFLSHFPDIQSLAQAPQSKVMIQWAGLGYYARARNLHKSAQIIIKQHQGVFPRNYIDIIQLPGIGRSTAGAICAQAFNLPYPILDGNVKRVLSRFFQINGWPGDKKIEQKLWLHSKNLTPQKEIAIYTQAIMDLGASVCTRVRPRCQHCPVQNNCLALKHNKVALYPVKRPKKIIPTKQTIMLIIHNRQNQIWLQLRPQTGIWGGLQSLPEYQNLADIPKRLSKKRQLGNTLKHTFTHYHLIIQPLFISSSAKYPLTRGRWFDLKNLDEIALPTPVKKICAK